jgi:hypothetical protein
VNRTTFLKLALGTASLSALAFSQTKEAGVLIGGIATWSAQTNTSQWDHALGAATPARGAVMSRQSVCALSEMWRAPKT